MIAYKWTDADGQTRGCTQWGPGVEHTAPGGGPLCSDRWLHGYRSAELAVGMRLAHVLEYDVLWLCDGDEGMCDGTKSGFTRIRTIQVVDPPVISTAALVRWALYCAQEVTVPGNIPAWDRWAARWLAGNRAARTTNLVGMAEDVKAWSAAEAVKAERAERWEREESAAEEAETAEYAKAEAATAAGRAAESAAKTIKWMGPDHITSLLLRAIKEEEGK